MKKNRYVFFIVVFLMLNAHFVFGQWDLVEKKFENNSEIYVDYSNIKNVSNRLYYWLLINHPFDRDKAHKSTKIYRVVDCRKKKWKFLKLVYYQKKMGDEYIMEETKPNRWSKKLDKASETVCTKYAEERKTFQIRDND